MGASDAWFTINKKATRKQIEVAFKDRQSRDRDENGISGEFQPFDTVKHFDKTFDSLSEALEFCLDNSEKHYNMCSAYYIDKHDLTRTLVAGWSAH